MEKTHPVRGSKKEVRKQITALLNTAQPILSKGLSDKKMQKNLKKAGKALVAGFSAKEEKAPVKVTVKETSTPPAVKAKSAKKAKPVRQKTARSKSIRTTP